MPEVVVTKAVKESPRSPVPKEEADSNRLKAPDNRIWNLLPVREREREDPKHRNRGSLLN